MSISCSLIEGITWPSLLLLMRPIRASTSRSLPALVLGACSRPSCICAARSKYLPLTPVRCRYAVPPFAKLSFTKGIHSSSNSLHAKHVCECTQSACFAHNQSLALYAQLTLLPLRSERMGPAGICCGPCGWDSTELLMQRRPICGTPCSQSDQLICL